MLLIDEIDRADDDFEAFLLELLAEARVTIPELGTVTATHPPVIVLTSNRTRDLHDAARQVPLPVPLDRLPDSPARGGDRAPAREGGVGDACRPGGGRGLAHARQRRSQKPPGIAEAIDWLAASLLGIERLDPGAVNLTLGSVLKYDEDQDVIRAAGLEQLVRSGD